MTPEEKIQTCITALVETERLLALGDSVDRAGEIVGQALMATSEPTTYWRPMESAPRNGDRVLLALRDGMVGYTVARWRGNDGPWRGHGGTFHDAGITGWMPIPE